MALRITAQRQAVSITACAKTGFVSTPQHSAVPHPHLQIAAPWPLMSAFADQIAAPWPLMSAFADQIAAPWPLMSAFADQLQREPHCHEQAVAMCTWTKQWYVAGCFSCQVLSVGLRKAPYLSSRICERGFGLPQPEASTRYWHAQQGALHVALLQCLAHEVKVEPGSNILHVLHLACACTVQLQQMAPWLGAVRHGQRAPASIP
jgi:hypothetical protein